MNQQAQDMPIKIVYFFRIWKKCAIVKFMATIWNPFHLLATQIWS